LVQALCGQATVLARSGACGVVPGCVLAQQLPSSTWCPMRTSLWHARSQPYAKLTTLTGSLAAWKASLVWILSHQVPSAENRLCRFHSVCHSPNTRADHATRSRCRTGRRSPRPPAGDTEHHSAQQNAT
jgi:hypothetical protein